MAPMDIKTAAKLQLTEAETVRLEEIRDAWKASTSRVTDLTEAARELTKEARRLEKKRRRLPPGGGAGAQAREEALQRDGLVHRPPRRSQQGSVASGERRQGEGLETGIVTRLSSVPCETWGV